MISEQEKFIVFYILLTNIWVTTLLCAVVASGSGATGGGDLYFPLAELALRVPAQVPAGAPLLRMAAMRRSAPSPHEHASSTAPASASAPAATASASAATAPDATSPDGATPTAFDATTATDGDEAGQVAYSIRDSSAEGDVLSVVPTTGELRLADDLTRKDGEKQSTVTLMASSPGTPSAELRINITLLPESDKDLDCDAITQELCFWPSVLFQIPENRPPSLLGSLGPNYLSDLCPQYNLSYILENGSAPDALSVSAPGSHGPWLLRTRAPLDRETNPGGALLSTRVACAVTSPTAVRNATADVQVVIIDEDDSPLELQAEPVIDLYLNGSQLTRGTFVEGPALSFTDADTLEPNSYTFTLVNEDSRLFLLPECAQDQAEHLGRERTAISCRLEAAKTDDLPQDPYTFVMQANDTSLKPGVSPMSHVDVTINIHAGFPPTTLPSMMKMKMMSTSVMNDVSTMEMEMVTSMPPPPAPVFPSKTQVMKSATKYARIAQPMGPVISADMTQSSGLPFRFSLVTNDGSKHLMQAFNVTPYGGIVYVNDPQALIDAPNPILLEVMWNQTNSERSGLVKIEIALENASSTECMPQNKDDMKNMNRNNSDSTQKNMMTNASKPMDTTMNKMNKDKEGSIQMDSTMKNNSMDELSMKNSHHSSKMSMKMMDYPHSCASQSSFKACVSFCGLGTGGKNTKASKGCTWKGTKSGAPEPPLKYATCTPDASTCPDGVCDPLEDMHPELCPQDCTTMKSGANVTRGIVGGSGICTCDDSGQCYCMPLTTMPQRSSTQSPMSTVAAAPLNTDCPNKGANPSCGGLCQLFLILVSLLIIAGVIAILLWRYKTRHGSLSCPPCPPLPFTCPPVCCKDCACKNDALFSWLPKRLQRHPPPAVAPTPTSRVSSDFEHPTLQSVDAHLLPYGYLAPLGQFNPMNK